MKASRYTEAQINAILRPAEGGVPVADLCRPAHPAGAAAANRIDRTPQPHGSARMARQYIIESIDEAQDHATQRLWICNNGRPNTPFTVCRQTNASQRGIGGITPEEFETLHARKAG